MFSVQRGPFFEPFYQCVTYGTSQASERVYNIVNFITLFVIPLLGLSLSYASIYCTLSSKCKTGLPRGCLSQWWVQAGSVGRGKGGAGVEAK